MARLLRHQPLLAGVLLRCKRSQRNLAAGIITFIPSFWGQHVAWGSCYIHDDTRSWPTFVTAIVSAPVNHIFACMHHLRCTPHMHILAVLPHLHTAASLEGTRQLGSAAYCAMPTHYCKIDGSFHAGSLGKRGCTFCASTVLIMASIRPLLVSTWLCCTWHLL